MKTKFITKWLAICYLVCAISEMAFSQGTAFTYQGRIADNGTNFNGTGKFKFALVASVTNHPPAVNYSTTGTFLSGYDITFVITDPGDGYLSTPVAQINYSDLQGSFTSYPAVTLGNGMVTAISPVGLGSSPGVVNILNFSITPPPAGVTFTTYWSNDGTSIAGGEPAAAVSQVVSNGLFTLVLGDTTVANMTAIPAAIFSTQPNLQLRIWFDDGVNGSKVLDPPQNLTPTPYAIFAEGTSNLLGVIPSGNLSGTYSGPVTFNNVGNSYIGDGSGLANVNAATLATGAALGAGSGNSISSSGATDSFLGGGSGNSIGANSLYAAIDGGQNNIIEANAGWSVIAGGEGNVTYSGWSVISGGNGNFVGSGTSESTIGGGLSNTNTASFATVPGGYKNVASGEYSFAAGDQAQAVNQGAFVWADSQNYIFSSTANDQFLVRAQGGVGIGEANPAGALHITAPARTPPSSLPNADNGLVLGTTGMSGYKWIQSFGGPLVLNPTSNDVGIGTTSPDELLTVNGSADKPGGGSWNTFSDGRLKDVGTKFTHGLDALDEIQPVHYHYKADNPLNLPSQPEYVGVVAQQVQKAVPEAVQRNKDGYLVLNNDPIIWTMVNAIRELNQKRETEAKEKDAQIQDLKLSVAELRKLVQSLTEKK